MVDKVWERSASAATDIHTRSREAIVAAWNRPVEWHAADHSSSWHSLSRQTAIKIFSSSFLLRADVRTA